MLLNQSNQHNNGAKMDVDTILNVHLKLTERELGKLEEVSSLVQEYPGWMVNRQMTGRYPEEIK
jgi:hypothetical protein